VLLFVVKDCVDRKLIRVLKNVSWWRRLMWEGVGMVVDIAGGKMGGRIVVEQCLEHFLLVW
jgi:hypothetical protein